MKINATCLDVPIDEASELITDGGNDAGVDGLNAGEVGSTVFLVQENFVGVRLCNNYCCRRKNTK
ncbi:MAG: hypothetical protein FDX02_04560 [Chlorobium sp.]|nr:MAG: hypothetical protein FDX02_04560 [Chlorobium sp.]